MNDNIMDIMNGNNNLIKLIEGCAFTTSKVYGDCWNCHVAEQCPTWQGISDKRVYVDPADPYIAVDIK